MTRALIALLVIVGFGSAAMALAGVNPVDGFSALLVGALGSSPEVAETLVQTTALLFPALGIALAFRAGLFNIGAEGQLIVGGLFVGVVGEHLIAPGFLAIPILLALGALGGGVWGALAGALRARFEANEVIATLMLNIVARLFAAYVIAGPLKSAAGGSGEETGSLPAASWLPTLIPDTRLTISLLLAIALALFLRWLFRSSVIGYELRAAGDAPETARRAGIDLAKTAFWAMAASGAIAGLGGATIVMGVLHRFNLALSPGYGFIAIAVALVGELDPLWVTLAAFVFGILQNGAIGMQAAANVPRDVITAIEGVIILVLAGRRALAR
ncbi:MAG: ABC transporter permease [Candidatus Eremiobacteraeota bacterium]|nr:ABC transporter permease [Candidatus Eremiobacteraeota bacterium]MBV8355551.1 ABC transporter permease [Candidatus Eremiobacteraeota bacterium]